MKIANGIRFITFILGGVFLLNPGLGHAYLFSAKTFEINNNLVVLLGDCHNLDSIEANQEQTAKLNNIFDDLSRRNVDFRILLEGRAYDWSWIGSSAPEYSSLGETDDKFTFSENNVTLNKWSRSDSAVSDFQFAPYLVTDSIGKNNVATLSFMEGSGKHRERLKGIDSRVVVKYSSLDSDDGIDIFENIDLLLRHKISSLGPFKLPVSSFLEEKLDTFRSSWKNSIRNAKIETGIERLNNQVRRSILSNQRGSSRYGVYDEGSLNMLLNLEILAEVCSEKAPKVSFVMVGYRHLQWVARTLKNLGYLERSSHNVDLLDNTPGDEVVRDERGRFFPQDSQYKGIEEVLISLVSPDALAKISRSSVQKYFTDFEYDGNFISMVSKDVGLFAIDADDLNDPILDNLISPVDVKFLESTGCIDSTTTVGEFIMFFYMEPIQSASL